MPHGRVSARAQLERLLAGSDRAGGSLAGLERLDHEVAVHRPAQLARDVQAESAAVLGVRAAAPAELLEEVGPILVGHARAVVDDRHRDPAVGRVVVISRARN